MVLLVLLAILIHVSHNLFRQVNPLNFLIFAVLLCDDLNVPFGVGFVLKEEFLIRYLLDSVSVREDRIDNFQFIDQSPFNSLL